MTNKETFTDMRFWLVGFLAVPVLILFAVYFWGRRKVGNSLLQYPWALVVGLPMAFGNMYFNVVIASFIFLRLPPLRNRGGEFSPFFTTRINYYLDNGIELRLSRYLASVINIYDPDHFRI